MSGVVGSEPITVKSERRLVRGLLFAFICMIMGALFYSANTETLDNCRAIYDDIAIESGAP